MKQEQQLIAEKLAKKASQTLVSVNHPKRSVLVDAYADDILLSIPLLELLEVANAASCVNNCPGSQELLCLSEALTNLKQKGIEL